MYTLCRSPTTFYECLITVVIALLCITAVQKKFLYYALVIQVGLYLKTKIFFSRGFIANFCFFYYISTEVNPLNLEVLPDSLLQAVT